MRDKKLDITISEPITLADLRWLIEQCTELADETLVSVQGAKEFNQFDREPATITVRGKL